MKAKMRRILGVLFLLSILMAVLTVSAAAAVDEFGRICIYHCYYYGWNETTNNYDIVLDREDYNNGPYPITAGFALYRRGFNDWTYNASLSKYVDMFKASEGWGIDRDMNCYYFYTPTPHVVTYKITGSYLANDSYQTQSYTNNRMVSVLNNPVVSGYIFDGWTSENVTIQNGTFTMPAYDVTINGSFTPRTDTPYTVQFYQQDITGDGYTQITTDSFSGTGTTETPIKDLLDLSSLSLKYPGFHLSDTSQNDTTTIAGNGNSVLKLYYDRDTPNVTYAFDGTLPLANPPAPATASHRYGSTVDIAGVPTLAGYDFSGWTSADIDLSSGSFTMQDNDITITGTWIPLTDTPYTVEFYQQDIDDDGYMQITTDTFSGQGTTDTQIIRDALGESALNAKYPGFHLSDASQNNATTIDGDGSTVLKLYYDRNTPNVIYSYNYMPPNVPDLPSKTTARYEATVTVAEIPALTGYDFSGWTSADIDLSSGFFNMPDNDIAITGTWTPLPEPYQVEYYLQELDGSYTLADTENCTGLTDTQALAPAKGYPGFTETSASKGAEVNTTINGDGSTVLKLCFDRSLYTVSYAYQGDTDVTPPELPAAATYRYGETVPVSTLAPSLQGYDFSGWKTQNAEIVDGVFTIPAKDVAVIGTWYPKDGIPFQVMYYQQNLDDDDFTLVDTVNGKGVTGKTILDIHRDYEGFAETAASVTAEETKIASDGSTVISLYFDRGSFAVSYAYSGGGAVPADAPALPAGQTCKYGQTVTLPDTPTTAESGKMFSGWTVNGTAVSGVTFLMPGTDAVVTGVWQIPQTGGGGESQVKEPVLPVNFISDGNTVATQNVESGKTVSEPSAPTKAGYTFAGWYADSDCTEPWNFTETITASTVLYAKWEPVMYTVSFNANGGSSVPVQAVAYGGLVIKPAAPVRTGYAFTGWYADSTLVNAWSFTEDTVLTDMTLYAAWTAKQQYIVAFESNGGSSVPSQTVAYGRVATQPAAPTRYGYAFAGWYADGSLSRAWNFTENTIKVNTTLYAKWTASKLLAVSYESNRGNSAASTDVSSDDLIITFESAGGSTISARIVKYGQLLEKPADPVKAGCIFAGWYTDPDCTDAWSFPATVSRNTTLYAKWEDAAAPLPIAEKPLNKSEPASHVGLQISGHFIMAAVAALSLALLFMLLVIKSRRVKFYYMDGGAYRILCRGAIRHGAIDITAAYRAANEGTVMVKISRFYALRHLGRQISIRLKGHTLLTDRLGLNNKYVIGEA